MHRYLIKSLKGITLLLCLPLSSQQAIITGQVIDTQDEIMPFAHVLLLQHHDSVMVKGVTTDTEGRFTMEEIPIGNYVLNISLLGFEPYFRPVSINDSKELSMGTIQLTIMNQQLQGVQVVGQKALYQQKSDRLILNVGSQPTFSGKNALQVLQKAPGVIVQENSNSISVNNKGEVLIMINDRVSRIPKANLIQQLKGIRAENIDRIELIHQPGAKYDSDNASGIIHIVMKENNTYGFNGNASLTIGIGQREKFNGNTDLNYRNNRINIYGNVTGFHNKSPMATVNHFRNYEYQGDYYYYENNLRFENPANNSLGITVGADFEIDKNNIVGGLFGYSRNNMLGHNFTSISKGTVNSVPNTESQFLLDINNPSRNTFINLNYFRKIGANSSLNVDVDRVILDVQNSSDLNNLNPEETIEKTSANRESQFKINTVRADFEWKNEAGNKLETGVKGTFNNSNTQSLIQNRIADISGDDEAFSTNDDIAEKVLAAYASFYKKWNGKWESNLGLRLEHYNYELEDTSGENDFNVTYNNLFPVVRTSYAIDSTNSLTLSMNRRIERPSFFHLAGFYFLIDPSLFVSSNTRIRPSFTNAARLAYNHNSLLIAFEINRANGTIAFYNTVDKERGLQTSMPINFDRMDGYLLNISFPIKISKIWKMNWNLDGAYQKVKDVSNRPSPFEKGIFTVTAQLTNIFELSNSWTANIDGRYMSPHIDGDQVQYIHHYINFGVSKKFKNESSITFSVQDITATGGKDEWEYDQPELGINTYGKNNFSERVFQLTYSFPFGNQKVKEKRNRKTGSQEERDRM